MDETLKEISMLYDAQHENILMRFYLLTGLSKSPAKIHFAASSA